MRTITGDKAAAICAAIRTHDPTHILGAWAHLLACLTSAQKSDRDFGKQQVRNLVKIGQQILQADQAATNLANFANRHDPIIINIGYPLIYKGTCVQARIVDQPFPMRIALLCKQFIGSL